jgi:DNA-binding beta-propeller fold protein YncE
MRKSVFVMAATALVCAAVVGGPATRSLSAQNVKPPRFQVDPSWPQELPNNWIFGSITGVFVDSRQHVWVSHLPETLTEEELGLVQKPPFGECCQAAPSVIEFDPQGKVVGSFPDGTPENVAQWPRNPHGIFVDHNNFVWVGTHMHHRVMKFTREGKMVLTIGTYDKNAGSNDTSLLGGPAGIWVDPKTNEAFIADGYRNRRVIVFDAATGKYLRHWGAYGKAPDDTQKNANDPSTPNGQFSTVHGIIGSNDGMIYVADRRGNRIQVFDHSGKFIKEKIIAPNTRASGSAFAFSFSPDAAQTYIHMADGTNHKVWNLRRSDLEIVGSFGHGGRHLGQMLRPHGMSYDAKGNLYVGEASTGRRIQKFNLISK